MAYVEVEFYIKKRGVTKSFVKTLVDSLIHNGASYIEGLGYFLYDSSNRHRDGSLNDAVGEIGRFQGSLSFFYKDLDFDLEIYPDCSGPFGLISLSTEVTRPYTQFYPFDNEASSRQFIELAVIVWNTLAEKPVYGCGDIRDLLPQAWAGKGDEKEKKLYKLDIDINHYWLNFYGALLIDKFSLEKLKHGAGKVVVLDRGVLCITEEDKG